jgi:MurNAc alpha-1-phosphate uridylyltransferase
MQAVILAGGLGTRMYPETRQLPKALMPVAGRPFLAWQLQKIKSSGFSEVVLCVGHLGDKIREFVGDGRQFDMRILISDEGEQQLGTGGALRQALDLLSESFLVTYGDSYLPFDYAGPLQDLTAHPDALGTMSVFFNQGRWDASNTEIEADRVVRYEKGGDDPALAYIDYGALALRRRVVEGLAAGVRLGLETVQAALANQRRLRAFVAEERFYEVGSPGGLHDLEQLLIAEA